MKKKASKKWLFLLPSFAGVLIFVLIPFLDVVRRSFLGGRKGAGLFQNFAAVIQNDAFQLATKNTVSFFMVCLPLLFALSLGLALLIKNVTKGKNFFKTIFLLPITVPVASLVLIWRFLFESQGALNHLLVLLGGEPKQWMNSPLAFWVLVLSYLWKNIGFDMILWLSGLYAVPASLYEAALVDGASRFQTFFKVTLPQLASSFRLIFLFSLINGFKVFREAFLIAGDYPHDSIYLYQHLFGNWFRNLAFDKLSAGAVLVALGILAIIIVTSRWGRRKK